MRSLSIERGGTVMMTDHSEGKDNRDDEEDRHEDGATAEPRRLRSDYFQTPPGARAYLKKTF